MDNLGILWRFPPPKIDLQTNEIHAWCAPLSLGRKTLDQHLSILDDQEKERAERFLAASDKRRFVKGRSLLREILSFYLQMDPRDIKFEYSEYHKPAIANYHPEHFEFNVSHSEDLIVIGISRSIPIGLDIESTNRSQKDLELASEFLSPGELALLQKVPETQKLEAFLNCWTRKEAYLKAIGKGLVDSLSEIRVNIAPGEPARFISLYGDKLEPKEWLLQSIQPAIGFTGAVACRQRGLRLACWRWPENAEAYFSKRKHSKVELI